MFCFHFFAHIFIVTEGEELPEVTATLEVNCHSLGLNHLFFPSIIANRFFYLFSIFQGNSHIREL